MITPEIAKLLNKAEKTVLDNLKIAESHLDKLPEDKRKDAAAKMREIKAAIASGNTTKLHSITEEMKGWL